MKSNKTFLFLILLMMVLLWLFNALLINISNNTNGSIQKILLVIMGISIMKYSLASADFKTFIILYGGVWGIYILIRLFTIIIPQIHLASGTIFTIRLANLYISFSQITNALPFVIFWLFIKSSNTVIENK